jgi:hypothetical protein
LNLEILIVSRYEHLLAWVTYSFTGLNFSAAILILVAFAIVLLDCRIDMQRRREERRMESSDQARLDGPERSEMSHISTTI